MGTLKTDVWQVLPLSVCSMNNDGWMLNFLGALALGLVNTLNAIVEAKTGHGGEFSVAWVRLGAELGLSIKALRQILCLSHSGTVRLVDRLEAMMTDAGRADTTCRLCDGTACPDDRCPMEPNQLEPNQVERKQRRSVIL